MLRCVNNYLKVATISSMAFFQFRNNCTIRNTLHCIHNTYVLINQTTNLGAVVLLKKSIIKLSKDVFHVALYKKEEIPYG